VTSRRCPNCGGLVGADAEWCTQCLTRLDRPGPSSSSAPSDPRTPAVDAPEIAGPLGGQVPPPPGGPVGPSRAPAGGSGRPIRPSERGVVWDCPTCQSENPIEAMSCGVCGTPFGKLLEEPEPAPRSDPGRAMAYSLLFPGMGHVVAGRAADGAARAVIFAYAAATAIIILVMTGGEPGPFLSLLVASAAVAVGLYVVSAMDAARVARGEPPLVTARILLYGGAGLILLTVVVLVVVGLRTGGAGGLTVPAGAPGP
jgi:hypothetical protein